MPPLPPLSSEARRRGMRLSIFEGLAFAAMVGLGEVFFVADAIRLGATRLEQGLVVTLPLFVGSLGPLAALTVLGRARTRRPLVVGATLLQVACLLVLAATDFLGSSSVTSLLACVCVYHFSGQAVGTGWASWFGDLVPPEERGGYFARRNRGIYTVTSLALLTGGLTLQRLEPGAAVDGGGGGGYALLFLLGGLARGVSAAFHARIPEPAFARPFTGQRLRSFLATGRGRSTGRLIGLTALVYFAVYLASPYFTPYMLGPLAFSYVEFTLASLIIVLLKVTFLPAWGASIQQLGARSVFLTCALLIALVPLPWLWAQGLGWVLFAQGLSGLSWAGFELSLFCVLIEKSFRGARPYVFALHTALNGAAQLAGGVVGALLAGAFGGDLRFVFGLSLAGRLLALPWLTRATRTARDVEVPKGEVLLRVIGLRPSGGVGLRPVPLPEDPPPDEAAEEAAEEA